jgi:hypothetical protein
VRGVEAPAGVEGGEHRLRGEVVRELRADAAGQEPVHGHDMPVVDLGEHLGFGQRPDDHLGVADGRRLGCGHPPPRGHVAMVSPFGFSVVLQPSLPGRADPVPGHH